MRRGQAWSLKWSVGSRLLRLPQGFPGRSVPLSAEKCVRPVWQLSARPLPCRRTHCRRQDRHQQGPGGVPEPPADCGGPGHRGIHHPLHCQSQAGGCPGTRETWGIVATGVARWSSPCSQGLRPWVSSLASPTCSFLEPRALHAGPEALSLPCSATHRAMGGAHSASQP